MKPEEAKDILSDMRDQHLCFLESSENKDEWQKKYLKEAWACDSGAKALEKQIPCKPEEYVPDFPYNIFSTQKCAKCGTPVIGKLTGAKKMTYNIDESVIARSVDHYGEEIKATVCMEECAELIQAISKEKRGKSTVIT